MHSTSRSYRTMSGVKPAGLLVGILLANSDAFSPPGGVFSSSTCSLVVGHATERPRALVHRRPRRLLTLRASAGDDCGLEPSGMESSDLYSELRRRLKELEAERAATELPAQPSAFSQGPDDQSGCEKDQSSDVGRGGGGGNSRQINYSGKDMKKAYYEAFWRARGKPAPANRPESVPRNLRKRDNNDSTSSLSFESATEGLSTQRESTANPEAEPDAQATTSSSSAVTRDCVAQVGQPPAGVEVVTPKRESILSPTAMRLLSKIPTAAVAYVADAPTRASEVQGLTQMFYLEEPELQPSEAFAAIGDWQGLSQGFSLVEGVELEGVGMVPVREVEGGSLLSGLGVGEEMILALREVELEHARLAMLAVMVASCLSISGMGAAAGGVHHNGLVELAELARAPILQPWLAAALVTGKVLKEGDWRLGKGVLAGWADTVLRTLSEAGSKTIRRFSGEQVRRFALASEVHNGRLALASVVGVLAQQGLSEVSPWITSLGVAAS